MLSKIIAFLKSRPTETWLGLWTAAVAALTYFGVALDAALVTLVQTIVAALVTFLASRPTNSLGPQ